MLFYCVLSRYNKVLELCYDISFVLHDFVCSLLYVHEQFQNYFHEYNEV